MSGIFENAQTGDIFICKNRKEFVFVKTEEDMVRLIEYAQGTEHIILYHLNGTHISGNDELTIMEKKSNIQRTRDFWSGYVVGLTDAYMALQEILPVEEKENIIKEFRNRTGF